MQLQRVFYECGQLQRCLKFKEKLSLRLMCIGRKPSQPVYCKGFTSTHCRKLPFEFHLLPPCLLLLHQITKGFVKAYCIKIFYDKISLHVFPLATNGVNERQDIFGQKLSNKAHLQERIREKTQCTMRRPTSIPYLQSIRQRVKEVLNRFLKFSGQQNGPHEFQC